MTGMGKIALGLVFQRNTFRGSNGKGRYMKRL